LPDIRYVCLSDLHFGAENSILSRLVPGQVVVDTDHASSVLDALVAVLAELVGTNSPDSPKPILVLNGDVLELALASDNVALMVFELFLDRVYRAEGEALFDPTILYQPGNHDHHLWETARELQYANLMNELAPGAPLPIPWHATSLYYQEDPRPVYSPLLEQLAARHSPSQGVKFRVSYPNMGIRSADGRTAIVFHHGHFVESIYSLMTTLKDYVFPGRVKPIQAWDIEAENLAWIDFLWSTLGRSGHVGKDVDLIYDMLQSNAAIEILAHNLAVEITAKVTTKQPLEWFRWAVGPIIDWCLKKVATKVAARERKIPTSALSADAQTGLMAYLSGPIIKQLAGEANTDGKLPEQVKFIFGHTHKPFVGTRDVPGLANPVRIFNTGGFVVDTLVFEPLHGANLILIDEDLEVACVRLYNQAGEDGAYQVKLDDGLPAEQGPFYQRLSTLIDPKADPWKSFSTAAAGLVVEREAALKTITANAGHPRPKAAPSTSAAPQALPSW
jgi:hypothetical protein